MTNLLDQVAALVSLASDPPVALFSGHMGEDLGSRFDHAY
jgi:hypothetical protein